MIQGKKNWLGLLFMAVLMGVTGAVLLRGQKAGLLWACVKQMKPQFLLLGLVLMLGYVGCEALCSYQILSRFGHPVTYRRCLGYSFVGFYVSSITPAAHGALNMMLIASCYQVATLLWGMGIWLFFPSAHGEMDGGLGLLLLYGAGMMILLTVGMAMVMFLPGPTRRICEGVLALLTKIRILRNPEAAREKLEHQLAEYARGAECVKHNPGLVLRVLALCVIQLGLLFSVPWTVYLALGLTEHSWIQVAGVQALLTLAVCNLPLPGAVGAAEGSFVKAFESIFGAAMVTPAMLVSRGISFYAFLFISFGVSIAVHMRTSREARERALQEMVASQNGTRVKAVRRYLSARAEEV